MFLDKKAELKLKYPFLPERQIEVKAKIALKFDRYKKRTYKTESYNVGRRNNNPERRRKSFSTKYSGLENYFKTVQRQHQCWTENRCKKDDENDEIINLVTSSDGEERNEEEEKITDISVEQKDEDEEEEEIINLISSSDSEESFVSDDKKSPEKRASKIKTEKIPLKEVPIIDEEHSSQNDENVENSQNHLLKTPAAQIIGWPFPRLRSPLENEPFKPIQNEVIVEQKSNFCGFCCVFLQIKSFFYSSLNRNVMKLCLMKKN